jgi:hypothetical protein
LYIQNKLIFLFLIFMEIFRYEVKHVYGTKKYITGIIRSAFMNQITWQLTKIVGSLDLVGNPISLINSLGTGVKDFFYEPSQAFLFTLSLS